MSPTSTVRTGVDNLEGIAFVLSCSFARATVIEETRLKRMFAIDSRSLFEAGLSMVLLGGGVVDAPTSSRWGRPFIGFSRVAIVIDYRQSLA